MSITIENKAGVADKFKNAQSIAAGSGVFSKIKRGVKEVIGKVGDKVKDVVEFVKENPRITAAAIGFIALGAACVASMDANTIKVMDAMSNARETVTMTPEKLKEIGKVFGGVFASVGLVITKSMHSASKEDKASVASKQAQANTGR